MCKANRTSPALASANQIQGQARVPRHHIFSQAFAKDRYSVRGAELLRMQLGGKPFKASGLNSTAADLLGCTSTAQRRMFFSMGGQDHVDSEKLYRVLEVAPTASEAEIKKSFFNLAKKYHPDVNKTKEAKKKYLEITEAYETLSDPKKRKIYDKYGMNANEQANAEINPENFGSFASVLGAIFRGDTPGDPEQEARHRTYDEILEEYEKFFSLDEEILKEQEAQSNRSSSARKGGSSTGTNRFVNVEIDFADAVTGVQRNVSYSRQIRCNACEGKGVQQISEDQACPVCFGSGDDPNSLGEVCPACLGTGIASVKCIKCRGEGLVTERAHLLVRIPKSVDDGMLLRIREKGDQAPNGRFGDLIIKVQVAEHPEFKRIGYDMYSNKKISVTQAIIGGAVHVDTTHGKRSLTIAPGTEHNQEYRIKGAGLAVLGKGSKGGLAGSDQEEKGDHVVVVKIAIPSSLTSEQKSALENYARIEDRLNL